MNKEELLAFIEWLYDNDYSIITSYQYYNDELNDDDIEAIITKYLKEIEQ